VPPSDLQFVFGKGAALAVPLRSHQDRALAPRGSRQHEKDFLKHAVVIVILISDRLLHAIGMYVDWVLKISARRSDNVKSGNVDGSDSEDATCARFSCDLAAR
jgi:hypothetical protein